MEPIVNLLRLRRGDQGTRGILIYDNYMCHTLELPWRKNRRSLSCIPAGEYNVDIRLSPKYGNIYHVKEVPNRKYILIHSGNWAGDVKKGFKTHVNGCIILGKDSGLLQGQWAVLNSRITVKRFMKTMKVQPFKLRILESF